MTTNPLFSDQEDHIDPVVEDKNWAEELVGEGKKFKDIAALAKAKAESDAFIERLKAENAEARAALKGEQKMDEFLDKLRNAQSAAAGNASTQGTTPAEPAIQQNSQSNNNKALSIEEVQKLLDTRDRSKTEQSNLEFAAQRVKQKYGANYTTVMAQKASEYGMTPDDLTNLAKTRPQAFLKLVEADTPSTPEANAPVNRMNTAAIPQQKTGDRTNAYYKDLRKKVGDAAFFKPAIQNQLHADMLRNKDAFFK